MTPALRSVITGQLADVRIAKSLSGANEFLNLRIEFNDAILSLDLT
jgi:hypothetical protein